MPAASCRIIPARNIRRCDTISASLGVSRKIGKKNRERRMGWRGSRSIGGAPSETGLPAKTQGPPGKAAETLSSRAGTPDERVAAHLATRVGRHAGDPQAIVRLRRNPGAGHHILKWAG